MDREVNSTDTGSRSYVVLVCFIAALGGLLFGYDTAVINGAIGFLETHFELSSTMKGWAASSALLGCVIGVSFAGVFSDRLGRKKTLVLAGVLFLVSSIGTAIPRTLTQLVIFRILAGVGVGVASMASPMYIAEIAPTHIRGRMVSVNQFAIISGMVIIYFVNYAIARLGTPEWQVSTSWRWMFASGIIPSLLLLGLLMLAPESPRWLIRQGHDEQARRILARVGGATYAAQEAESIGKTATDDGGSPRLLLAPGFRRVLVIGISLAVLQQVTGINVFLYFGTEIFKQLGTQVDVALLQQVVVGAVNLLFTVVAIWTVDAVGRKPLMLVGATGMGLSLLAMGLTAQFGQVAGWMVILVLGYIACFALSVGPVTWVILSEIFPLRIRGRALSVATLCLWAANFVVSQTFPMMEAEGSWFVRVFNHGFPFYLYAAFCGALLLVVLFLIPETKGKSLEEIERCWTGER